MKGISGYSSGFREEEAIFWVLLLLFNPQIEEYWFQKCVISLLINVIQMAAAHFQYWCGLHLLHLFNISAIVT